MSCRMLRIRAYRLKRHKLTRLLRDARDRTVALLRSGPGRRPSRARRPPRRGPVSYDRATPGSETITIGSGYGDDQLGAERRRARAHRLPARRATPPPIRARPGSADYTVLNRIVPTDATRAIELNGSVLSQASTAARPAATSGSTAPAGSSSARSAVFDVGGLLLSTIDLPSGFIDEHQRLLGALLDTGAGRVGSIQILTGAQINALSRTAMSR